MIRNLFCFHFSSLTCNFKNKTHSIGLESFLVNGCSLLILGKPHWRDLTGRGSKRVCSVILFSFIKCVRMYLLKKKKLCQYEL